MACTCTSSNQKPVCNNNNNYKKQTFHRSLNPGMYQPDVSSAQITVIQSPELEPLPATMINTRRQKLSLFIYQKSTPNGLMN